MGARMRGPLGVAAILAATLLLLSCDSWRTDLAPFAGMPCTEVVEGLEEARQVVADTFGGGVEGREAQETIAGTIEARPDCFSKEEVEFARGIRQLLPSSDAEADALRKAEEACGDLVGEESAQGGPGRSGAHGNPEQALADTDATLPSGEPERSFEEDGRVGFDYLDGAAYQGWVLVQESADGWFVKRVITCGDEAALGTAR